MFKTIFSAAKTMLGVVAFVLAFTFNASAQDRKVNGAQRLTDNMKTELSLNDDQYTKVLDINTTFVDKSAEVRKTATDKKEIAKSVKGFNEEREAKLKTVLTEDQYKKYIANKEAKKAQMKQRISESKAPQLTPATAPTAKPKS